MSSAVETISLPRTLLDPEYAGIGKVAASVENTHAIENSLAGMVGRIKGINIEGVLRFRLKIRELVAMIHKLMKK